MADWKVTSPVDYSPNGDDVDRFAQKSIATFEEIFEHLNDLRRHGAKAGLDEANTLPTMNRLPPQRRTNPVHFRTVASSTDASAVLGFTPKNAYTRPHSPTLRFKR